MAELEKTEILARNADALDAQLEERPLAKKQEQLQEEEDESEKSVADTNGTNEHGEEAKAGQGAEGEGATTEPAKSTTPKPEKHVRKALLKNDDTELVRVQKVRTS